MISGNVTPALITTSVFTTANSVYEMIKIALNFQNKYIKNNLTKLFKPSTNPNIAFYHMPEPIINKSVSK